ncbi:asparaginase domain-containing protein [Sphingomonas sp. SRS2]|uniref:asparaginase domain-containing protein n=1 Tax=Sphingomonas sp. SRS2 TaxID=133190 RepID=UPI000698105F|nr:asparaginase domain-containing protein [Sphingomonas sp. SRS2]
MKRNSAWACLGLLGIALLASPNATVAAPAPASHAAVPHIVVLATGGTIASGSERALSGEELVEQLHLDRQVRVEVKDVANGGLSNLTRADWSALVTAIRASFADPGVTGVVVTHGTDTMEETGFLLDLVIDGPRPIPPRRGC